MIKGGKAEKKQTKAEANFKSSKFYVGALLGAKTLLTKHGSIPSILGYHELSGSISVDLLTIDNQQLTIVTLATKLHSANYSNSINFYCSVYYRLIRHSATTTSQRGEPHAH